MASASRSKLKSKELLRTGLGFAAPLPGVVRRQGPLLMGL